MSLNRRFTPLNLLMLSINGMVGSAWLFAPLYAAKIAGPGAIIAWIVGGLATALIAFTFAEVSTIFPVAGGTAYLPRISHGILTSFILSWIAWISALTMAPIEVLAILQYASTYFTSLMHITNDIPQLTGIGFFWATLLMLSFCLLNIVSYKGLVGFNFILFIFKTFVILLVIASLIHNQFTFNNFDGFTTTFFSLTGWQAILTAVASGGVAFAFTGFKHGVELAGETKNLKIAIPLAIIGSVIICTLLYLGLQIAFIGSLDPVEIKNGWQSLSFVGDIGPFAGLALALGLTWLVKILYIDAVVSPSGAGLIYVTSTARILYAMSQIGYLPKFFSKVNKQNFPSPAIWLNFILGMFLFLPLSGWQSMVSFLVSGMVISYAAGPITLLCMRYELPHIERPFRLPFANLLCPLAFYFCNLLNYWTGWETISKLAITMLIGIMIFIMMQVKQRNMAHIHFKTSLWIIPYLLGLVLISYLGAFGGKNIIPFGWDFLVIGLFSLIILYFAVISRIAIATNVDIDTLIAQPVT